MKGLILVAFLGTLGTQEKAVDEAIRKYDQATQTAKSEFENKIRLEQEKLAVTLRDELKKAGAKGDVPLIQKISAKLAELGLEAAAPVGPDKNGLLPGLQVSEYPKVQDPKDWVPLSQLGDPVGEPYIIKSLEKWKRQTGTRVAVARGFIKITVPGEYGFQSYSGWNRDQLFVANKEVCAYAAGGKLYKVKLGAGMFPIVSVSWNWEEKYDNVDVKWLPPGAREVAPIPTELLFHKAVK